MLFVEAGVRPSDFFFSFLFPFRHLITVSSLNGSTLSILYQEAVLIFTQQQSNASGVRGTVLGKSHRPDYATLTFSLCASAARLNYSTRCIAMLTFVVLK